MCSCKQLSKRNEMMATLYISIETQRDTPETNKSHKIIHFKIKKKRKIIFVTQK